MRKIKKKQYYDHRKRSLTCFYLAKKAKEQEMVTSIMTDMDTIFIMKE